MNIPRFASDRMKRMTTKNNKKTKKEAQKRRSFISTRRSKPKALKFQFMTPRFCRTMSVWKKISSFESDLVGGNLRDSPQRRQRHRQQPAVEQDHEQSSSRETFVPYPVSTLETGFQPSVEPPVASAVVRKRVRKSPNHTCRYRPGPWRRFIDRCLEDVSIRVVIDLDHPLHVLNSEFSTWTISKTFKMVKVLQDYRLLSDSSTIASPGGGGGGPSSSSSSSPMVAPSFDGESTSFVELCEIINYQFAIMTNCMIPLRSVVSLKQREWISNSAKSTLTFLYDRFDLPVSLGWSLSSDDPQRRQSQSSGESSSMENLREKLETLFSGKMSSTDLLWEILDHCRGNNPPSFTENELSELTHRIYGIIWSQSESGLNGRHSMPTNGDGSAVVRRIYDHVLWLIAIHFVLWNPEYRCLQSLVDLLFTVCSFWRHPRVSYQSAVDMINNHPDLVFPKYKTVLGKHYTEERIYSKIFDIMGRFMCAQKHILLDLQGEDVESLSFLNAGDDSAAAALLRTIVPSDTRSLSVDFFSDIDEGPSFTTMIHGYTTESRFKPYPLPDGTDVASSPSSSSSRVEFEITKENFVDIFHVEPPRRSQNSFPSSSIRRFTSDLQRRCVLWETISRAFVGYSSFPFDIQNPSYKYLDWIHSNMTVYNGSRDDDDDDDDGDDDGAFDNNSSSLGADKTSSLRMTQILGNLNHQSSSESLTPISPENVKEIVKFVFENDVFTVRTSHSIEQFIRFYAPPFSSNNHNNNNSPPQERLFCIVPNDVSLFSRFEYMFIQGAAEDRHILDSTIRQRESFTSRSSSSKKQKRQQPQPQEEEELPQPSGLFIMDDDNDYDYLLDHTVDDPVVFESLLSEWVLREMNKRDSPTDCKMVLDKLKRCLDKRNER